jgi:hypothetical protein
MHVIKLVTEFIQYSSYINVYGIPVFAGFKSNFHKIHSLPSNSTFQLHSDNFKLLNNLIITVHCVTTTDRE